MLARQDKETIVTATDAKNNLGALLGRVAEGGEAVIVERQGKPRAAIISIEEYRQLRGLQNEERRREAVATIRRIRDEISERFKDLSDEEIESIAQDVRSDVTRGLFEKGSIKYSAE